MGLARIRVLGLGSVSRVEGLSCKLRSYDVDSCFDSNGPLLNRPSTIY